MRRMKPSPIVTRSLKIKHILSEEALRAGSTVEELKSDEKQRNVVWGRWRVMWRLQKEMSLSTPQIGKILNRHHTTVLHGLQAIRKNPTRILG